MKLSEKFSEKVTAYVKNTLPNKTEDDLEIIKYGVEILFMNLTKIPIILLIAYYLGIFKEVTFSILAFGIMRKFAAGIHATKSFVCLACSCIIFLGTVYLSISVKLPIMIKIVVFVLSLIVYFKYAPADTEEKPYVNYEIRKNLKIKSLITVTLYFILSLIIKDIFISNILIHILWIEGILISPITYKVFKRRYNNYEYY